MTPNTVRDILNDAFAAKRDGDTYTIDPERRLVVMLEHGSGILQIPKVHALSFSEDLLVLTTDENLYYLDPGAIFGLKAGDPQLDKADTRTGFRR